jgi:hypothetical protein
MLTYGKSQGEFPASLRFLKGKHKLNDINHFVLLNMTSEAFATAGEPHLPSRIAG